MKCLIKKEKIGKTKMNTKEKHQNPQSELKKKEALRLSNAESKALTRSDMLPFR